MHIFSKFMACAALGVASQFLSPVEASAQQGKKTVRFLNMGQLQSEKAGQYKKSQADHNKIVLGPGELVVVTLAKDTLVLTPTCAQGDGKIALGVVRTMVGNPHFELLLDYNENSYYLYSDKSVNTANLSSANVAVRRYNAKADGKIDFWY